MSLSGVYDNYLLAFYQSMKECKPSLYSAQGGSNPFNRWVVPNFDYKALKGFTTISYAGGWNPGYHDQLLKNSITAVY